MESIVDERGRILIPKEVREHLGIREGSLVEVVEDYERGLIVVKPSKEARGYGEKTGVAPFYGIGAKVRKTGRPEPWPSPREIKAIWE